MRSRYSAYVLNNEPWLLATWHPSTRPKSIELSTEPQPKWLDLKIVRHENTGTNQATVEFIARYRVAGRAQRLHEISRFVREDGHWYYLDGSFPE